MCEGSAVDGVPGLARATSYMLKSWVEPTDFANHADVNPDVLEANVRIGVYRSAM